MIDFPFKRIYGLIGANRCGKSQVANFLTETRGFVQIAFADQIKKEFGISPEDFEAAKIAGNIEELRERLWAFSAEKKKQDPEYFIKKVINIALDAEKPVVITDIRTVEELGAFTHIQKAPNDIQRVYWIRPRAEIEIDEKGFILGSKLTLEDIEDYRAVDLPNYEIRDIDNADQKGMYQFFRYLDFQFFHEDILDLVSHKHELIPYMKQFDIRWNSAYLEYRKATQ